MRATLHVFLCLSLLSSATSCVTIQNGSTCSVAGSLSAGAICSHLQDPETLDLDLDETIDLLEAQPDRECVPVTPGLNVCASAPQGATEKFPARAAAIIMPADDWNAMKTELEMACRELGSACSSKTLQLLQRLK